MVDDMVLCPECTSGDIEFFPTFNDPDPADVHCRCASCGHEWDMKEPAWDDDDDDQDAIEQERIDQLLDDPDFRTWLDNAPLADTKDVTP